MDKLPIHKDDLIKYQNDAEIVRKTALQVIKDFAQFGFEISFPDSIFVAYDQLFEQLIPALRELLIIDIGKLYSLLYTIDVNERMINKGLKEMPGISLEEIIAHLLLERELKKVLTREYFKKTGK